MNGRVIRQMMMSWLLGAGALAGHTLALANGPSEPPAIPDPPSVADRASPRQPANGLSIPRSLRADHKEVLSALDQATQAPGRLGSAARKLSTLLLPHFEREEKIALPPLGLLATLAANKRLPEAVESEALAMTASLRAEWPRMLQEHEQIRAAVEELRLAAEEANAAEQVAFAEQLALHARTEEEVLYSAAILVGDIIGMRQKTRD